MNSIDTSRFGVLEYRDEDVIRFPKGIPGFEDQHEWLLAGDDDDPVKWLQNRQNGSLALPVAVPLEIVSEYSVEVPEGDLKSLGADSSRDMGIFVVLTIPRDAPWNMMANLRAPIAINTVTRLAKQIVLMDDKFPIHTYVLSEEDRRNMEAQSCRPEESKC